MEKKEIETLQKAGNIAKQTVDYARELIKPGLPLLEIAEKIEAKIHELGAKPAFPVNLSINEMGAHATPPHNDEETASGLLKVDIGCHIDGYVADTAFSLDLDNSRENQSLIQATQSALQKALDSVQINSKLKEIGSTIAKEIDAHGFQPISNLSGHSIDKYELHSGLTIPSYNNSSETQLDEGLYAIEPFATLSTASGSVKDGGPSGIYKLKSQAQVRDSQAREVLQYIKEEYDTLPFCSRWIVKKFGTPSLLALKRLEDSNNLHHYNKLIERSGGKVAQAEHTVLLLKEEKIITTQ
jgi:methionyl aminopeptidase